MERKLQTLANNIRLIILDVDGVLTDGGLYFDNQGQEYKAFNSQDGHGIRLLLENDIQVALITGRQSELLLHRANNLKLSPDLIYQGYRDKLPAFEDLLQKTNLDKSQVAYIGDDVIDLPIMSQVGLSIAVKNANWFVKEHTDWICSKKGGHGAVREVCELLLDAQGKLDDLYHAYLNPE